MLFDMMMAMAGARTGATPSPPAAIARNSSAEVLHLTPAATFDVTLPLAAGTDRLVVAGGIIQTSQGSWDTGAVFDVNGVGATMPPVSAAVVNTGTRMVTRLYYYYIDDGVGAGDKIIRLPVTVVPNNGAILMAAAYNNVGGTAPGDFDSVQSNFDPSTMSAPAVTVSLDGSLVVSMLGSNQNVITFTPTGISTLLDLGSASAGGISLLLGDNINASAGALVTSWTRDVPGASNGGNIITAVFPRL